MTNPKSKKETKLSDKAILGSLREEELKNSINKKFDILLSSTIPIKRKERALNEFKLDLAAILTLGKNETSVEKQTKLELLNNKFSKYLEKIANKQTVSDKIQSKSGRINEISLLLADINNKLNIIKERGNSPQNQSTLSMYNDRLQIAEKLTNRAEQITALNLILTHLNEDISNPPKPPLQPTQLEKAVDAYSYSFTDKTSKNSEPYWQVRAVLANMKGKSFDDQIKLINAMLKSSSPNEMARQQLLKTVAVALKDRNVSQETKAKQTMPSEFKQPATPSSLETKQENTETSKPTVSAK